MIKSISQNTKAAGGAHWSAVEVRDKFYQTVNCPSEFVPWQNERVQSFANLQYSALLPILLLFFLIDASYNFSDLRNFSANFNSISEDKNRQHSWQAKTRSEVEVT